MRKAILVLLGAAISVSARAYPGCPPKIQNRFECARFIEHALIKKHPEMLKRDSRSLSVKLMNGQVKRVVDVNTDDSEKVRNFSAVDYFPDVHVIVLEAQLYEGTEYELLALRSGRKTVVTGKPVLSPNRKRFAVHMIDYGAAYEPNMLGVYRITPTGFEAEYWEKFKGWGPADVKWENDELISFKEFRLEVPPAQQKTRSLMSIGGQWQLR